MIKCLFFNLKYTRTYIFHTEPHPKRFQTIKNDRAPIMRSPEMEYHF